MLDTATTLPKHSPTLPASAGSPLLPRGALTARLRDTLAMALVLGTLGGLAAWGHYTGWSLPKFSALTGKASEPDDWCPAHSVPESLCVECRPELLPKGKEHGFCHKHGVAECPLCHPELAQLKKRPRVTAADLDRAEQALAFADRPENDSKCKKHLRRLQFASEAAADKAGIQVDVAALAPVVEAVSSNGEITYDQTRVARLSSRVPGSVWRVEKQVGDAVKRGEVLALVDAAEVGRAKTEFLQAYALAQLKSQTLENLRAASASVPARTVLEAEAALRQARIRLLSARQALINLGLPLQLDDLKRLSEAQLGDKLQFLGLPEETVRSLDAQTTSGNLLPIQAPMNGVIVHRGVVAGEVVDTAKVLFVVADPRTMWLTLNVRLEDAKLLKHGQTVHFRPDSQTAAALPWYTAIGARLRWNRTLDGTITWISTAVEEKTRTVQVRAEFANADGQLRAGTFGAGRVVLREGLAVVVPREAVHWEGCCHVVFVRDKNYHAAGAPKVFHVRQVVPGAKDDKNVEIIAGVLPGEVVAAAGSGVLRTELLRNDMGDG